MLLQNVIQLNFIFIFITIFYLIFFFISIYELKDKKGPELWDAKMVHYSTYTREQVEAAAQKLAAVVVKIRSSKFEVSLYLFCTDCFNVTKDD